MKKKTLRYTFHYIQLRYVHTWFSSCFCMPSLAMFKSGYGSLDPRPSWCLVGFGPSHVGLSILMGVPKMNGLEMFRVENPIKTDHVPKKIWCLTSLQALSLPKCPFPQIPQACHVHPARSESWLASRRAGSSASCNAACGPKWLRANSGVGRL